MTGILPAHAIERLIERKVVLLWIIPSTKGQIQPASLDLRLGDVAYRVRASFLPGPGVSCAKIVLMTSKCTKLTFPAAGPC